MRTGMLTMRVGRLVIPAVLLVVAVAGCGARVPEGQMAADAMNQEYRDAVAAFPFELPTGVEFPASVDDCQAGETWVYQTGYGEMKAYFFAETAWACAAIKAHASGDAGESHALDMMQQVHASPGFQAYFEDPDGQWQKVLDKARLGDYTDFAPSYGCEQFG